MPHLKKRYYFDEDTGAMKTGWHQEGENWYHLKSGTPENGGGYMTANNWIDFEGDRYYVDARGYRVTGTQSIDGTTYIFDQDGKLIR
jgi:glucan-binding YG repeat protein